MDRQTWGEALSRFYAENSAYHAMTAGGDKSTHPHARYLLEHVRPEGVYAEIGCGGGLVSGVVAETGVSVHGFDISPIAIANATKLYGSNRTLFRTASADAVPLGDASVDGAWSFEVMEHLWDPVAALQEMVRIVKPGGFIFVTCPNHFSLDLHLRKKSVVRAVEIGCALMRYLYDRFRRRYFVNIKPDILRDDVYPDCDMVSSLLPCRLPVLAKELGCQIEILSMYRMCARHEGSEKMALERYDRVPMLRWFGDHVFLWMVKEGF